MNESFIHCKVNTRRLRSTKFRYSNTWAISLDLVFTRCPDIRIDLLRAFTNRSLANLPTFNQAVFKKVYF